MLGFNFDILHCSSQFAQLLDSQIGLDKTTVIPLHDEQAGWLWLCGNNSATQSVSRSRANGQKSGQLLKVCFKQEDGKSKERVRGSAVQETVGRKDGPESFSKVCGGGNDARRAEVMWDSIDWRRSCD